MSFLLAARPGLAISGASLVPFEFQRGIIELPSLAGWVAILIEKPAGIIVLSVAFSLRLFTDYIISGAPVWYLRPRVVLSLPVIACLLIVLSLQ